MKILIYITEKQSVKFAYYLAIQFKKEFSDATFIGVTYTKQARDILMKLDKKRYFKKIYYQAETLIANDEPLTKSDQLKIDYIEKKYSRKTIWHYIYQDRYLLMTKRGFLYDYGTSFRRNTLLKTIIYRFNFIEKLFENEKPDIVHFITQDFGTSIATVIYEVAKNKKVPIYIPIVSQIGNYFSLNNNIYGTFPELQNSFLKNYKDRIKKFNVHNEINHYIIELAEKNKQSFYIVQKEKFNLNIIKRKLITLTKYLLKNYGRKEDYLYIPFHKFIRDKIVMKYRKRQILNSNIFYSFDKNTKDKFIFFPMHLEPELVLLVQSQEYLNQIEVIRNISRNLPNNLILYVKDHPTDIGRRKLSYYKKLNKIPNVKLIKASENSIEIMKHSIGVITIIGTAGLEAYFLNKPVITLSNAFYSFLPSIFQVNCLEDIAKIVDGFPDFVPNKKEQLVFLQTLINLSVDVNLLWLIDDINKNGLTNKNLPKFNEYFRFLIKKIRENINYDRVLR